MPRRNTRSHSSDSSDPGDAALEAQKRMLKLKKERAESIKVVAADFDAALAELRAKATAWHEDLQLQREDRRQHCRTEIIKLAERRENIEAQMAGIVTKAHEMVEELDAMMMAGYEGREKDAGSALEKVVAHQHRDKMRIYI